MINFKPLFLISLTSLSLLITSCGETANQANQSSELQITNNSNSPAELTEINVCYSGVSGTQIVTWYAFEKGLFNKYGLKPNLVSIEGGSTATAAMIAGEMDFCQIAGPAVVNAVVADQDLVMIAGLFNTYVTSIITNADIKTPEDLKGKALAISKPGGASDTELRKALKYLKLKPDEEVAIISIGEQGERLAAMETGQVVGTILSPPTTVIAKQKGYQELLKMSALNLPYQHTSLVTTKEYLQANPQIVENFLKAIVEAIYMMKQDQAGTVEVFSKYLLLELPENEAALNETYQVLVQEVLPEMPYPSLEGIQILLTELETENPQAQNFKPVDVVDTTILDKLENDGFIGHKSDPLQTPPQPSP